MGTVFFFDQASMDRSDRKLGVEGDLASLDSDKGCFPIQGTVLQSLGARRAAAAAAPAVRTFAADCDYARGRPLIETLSDRRIDLGGPSGGPRRGGCSRPARTPRASQPAFLARYRAVQPVKASKRFNDLDSRSPRPKSSQLRPRSSGPLPAFPFYSPFASATLMPSQYGLSSRNPFSRRAAGRRMRRRTETKASAGRVSARGSPFVFVSVIDRTQSQGGV